MGQELSWTVPAEDVRASLIWSCKFDSKLAVQNADEPFHGLERAELSGLIWQGSQRVARGNFSGSNQGYLNTLITKRRTKTT